MRPELVAILDSGLGFRWKGFGVTSQIVELEPKAQMGFGITVLYKFNIEIFNMPLLLE